MIGLWANLPSSCIKGTCLFLPRSLSFQSVCVNLPHSILPRSLINIIPVTHVRKRKQIIVNLKLQSTSLAQAPSREGLWQYDYIVTFFGKLYERNHDLQMTAVSFLTSPTSLCFNSSWMALDRLWQLPEGSWCETHLVGCGGMYLENERLPGK